MKSKLKIWSIWDFVLKDKNGKILKKWTERNLCPNEFLNDALGVVFDSGTQKTAWYMVLFENNHTPAAGDTYAVPGYTECTAYDEVNRPTVNFAVPATQSITNSANQAVFTMNATRTIYGAAIVAGGTAADTKGDVAGGGVLGPVSQFTGGAESVIATNVLNVTVTVSVADT